MRQADWMVRCVLPGNGILREMANAIVAQLLFLQAEDAKKEISMYINSPGGSVTAGLAILDTMRMVKCPVATYCVGQAASMGAILLSAGEKGKRHALPNSRIMIHQPWGGAQGKASDIEITAGGSWIRSYSPLPAPRRETRRVR